MVSYDVISVRVKQESRSLVSRFGRLICTSGSKAGSEYELIETTTTVGRSANSHIALDDQFASRHHAEILRQENAYQVHDLQSKNGVMIDGTRLSAGGTAWLEDGTEIQFASTRFRFYDPSATVTAPSLIAVREPGLKVDMNTRQVFVDGELLAPALSTKQFDLIWFLYQNRGRVVSKDEIAQAVWPEMQGEVYDANIDRMISRVRSRVESDDMVEPRFITTIRGYGYQLKTD